MTTASALVLFVSGWGADTPSLFQLVSTYPLCMISAPSHTLAAFYKHAGMVGETAIANVLTEKHMGDIRIADPDRYGLLTQTFDGGARIDQPSRRDIYTSFPPGMTIADAYESTLAMQKKQIVSALDEQKPQVVFASVSLAWSIALLRDAALTRQAVEQVSAAVESIADQALEAGIPLLICSDTPRLAGVASEHALLPCVLVHTAVEGLRGTGSDRAESRELPRRASGRLDQFGATVSALIGAEPPANVSPLFAPLLQRLRRV